jgi:hypothetical protein
MKIQKLIGTLLATGLLFATMINAHAEESEYSFKVHNNTKSTIKRLLVSENGKKWAEFDVGKGIAAGDSATLVWDSSTNNQECKQWVKAVFASGAEAKAVKFDFCEKGLELEF